MQLLKATWLVIGLAGASYAANISFSPAPTTDTGWNLCGNYPGFTCDTTAFFDPNSLLTTADNGISTLFSNAFNAWNDSVGNTWTLDNGGSLTGTFDVTTATANQFSGVKLGGLTIQVSVSDITLPTVPAGDELVWVQGLYLNYEVTSPLGSPAVTPYYAMDTTTLSGLACGGATGNFCPPAYPFQYNNNMFYDQPKTDYLPPGTTQNFFDANAYLAVEDPTNQVLTVYDGISYGFENAVSPEPGGYLLSAAGLALVAVMRRRRAA